MSRLTYLTEDSESEYQSEDYDPSEEVERRRALWRRRVDAGHADAMQRIRDAYHVAVEEIIRDAGAQLMRARATHRPGEERYNEEQRIRTDRDRLIAEEREVFEDNLVELQVWREVNLRRERTIR